MCREICVCACRLLKSNPQRTTQTSRATGRKDQQTKTMQQSREKDTDWFVQDVAEPPPPTPAAPPPPPAPPAVCCCADIQSDQALKVKLAATVQPRQRRRTVSRAKAPPGGEREDHIKWAPDLQPSANWPKPRPGFSSEPRSERRRRLSLSVGLV